MQIYFENAHRWQSKSLNNVILQRLACVNYIPSKHGKKCLLSNTVAFKLNKSKDLTCLCF